MTQESIITSEEAEHLAEALIQLENAEGELRCASILARARKAKGGIVYSIEDARTSLRQLIDTLTVEVKRQEISAKRADAKHEPVTVSTVEELNELPPYSVIYNSDGESLFKMRNGLWQYVSTSGSGSKTIQGDGPFTVVHRTPEVEVA